MKHYTEVDVPAKLEKRHTKTTCDLCNGEIKTQPYKRADINIEYGKIEYDKSEDDFPEGGCGVVTSYDICGPCFETVIMPFLASKGAVPTIGKWDF